MEHLGLLWSLRPQVNYSWSSPQIPAGPRSQRHVDRRSFKSSTKPLYLQRPGPTIILCQVLDGVEHMSCMALERSGKPLRLLSAFVSHHTHRHLLRLWTLKNTPWFCDLTSLNMDQIHANVLFYRTREWLSTQWKEYPINALSPLDWLRFLPSYQCLLQSI